MGWTIGVGIWLVVVVGVISSVRWYIRGKDREYVNEQLQRRYGGGKHGRS